MSRAVFVAIEEMNAEIAKLDAENASLRAELAAARAAERERCAKVCEATGEEFGEGGGEIWIATKCAKAIRTLTDES